MCGVANRCNVLLQSGPDVNGAIGAYVASVEVSDREKKKKKKKKKQKKKKKKKKKRCSWRVIEIVGFAQGVVMRMQREIDMARLARDQYHQARDDLWRDNEARRSVECAICLVTLPADVFFLFFFLFFSLVSCLSCRCCATKSTR
jgi:hypothetical protein